jgi:hypothetical protein
MRQPLTFFVLIATVALTLAAAILAWSARKNCRAAGPGMAGQPSLLALFLATVCGVVVTPTWSTGSRASSRSASSTAAARRARR